MMSDTGKSCRYRYATYSWNVSKDAGKGWTNIPTSLKPDGKASHCPLTSGESAKPIYYEVKDNISDKYKVVNASVCFGIYFYNGDGTPQFTNRGSHYVNDLPTLRVFDGSEYGRKAPQKTEPIRLMTQPTKLSTTRSKSDASTINHKQQGFEGVKYGYCVWYNIKGVTAKQLNNAILQLNFGRANSKCDVSIGWVRIETILEKDSYNLSIYSPDTLTTNTVESGKNFKHTIILTNKGSTGQYAYYKVTSPMNTKFLDCSNCGELQTSGDYKGYYKKWVPANSKVTLYHNYQIKTVGSFTFKDELKGILQNRTETQSYDWKVKSIAPEPVPEKESIIIIPSNLYINTSGQYIDVIISAIYNGDGTLVYRWNSNNNCTGNNSNHMLNISSNNVQVLSDSVKVTQNDISVNLTNQTISINPNPNGAFVAHLRVPVNPTDYNTYTYDNIDGYYYEGVFYKHYLYDETFNGYLHNGKFYKDEDYEEEIPLVNDKFYRDIPSSILYRYINDELEEIVAPSEWIFWEEIQPVNNEIFVDVLCGKVFKYYDDIPLKVCRQGGASSTATVDIYGSQYNIYNITTDNVGFEKDYQLVMHTNLDGVSVINCESSNFCFFEPLDTDYEVLIEKPSAYIGPIGLEHAHQADNTANTENGKISNNYLNRTYKGKTGNISEDIGMELFLSPGNVATLQGLVGMDKPIPLNLVPQMLDGDPLNHRGWANLYKVSNIKKINDHLYSCEPEVDYLTHDLNTSFQIIKENKIANYDIEYFLSQSHNFTDKLTNIMNVSLVKNVYNDMIDNNGFVGHYTINKNNELVFTSKSSISKFSDWDIKWRNILPILRSADYDNNLNISLQLVKNNVNSNEPTVYVEHIYDGFKHYNNTNNIALNRFDKVITRYLENGVYKEIVHGDYSLLMNNLTPLAYDNKIITKMWANSSTSIGLDDEYFDIILATDGNLLIGGEIVTVTVESDYGYYDQRKYMTDMYGRIRIKTDLENTDYNITVRFEETKDYRPCDFKISINVNKGLEVVSINYLDDYQTINSNDEIVIQLLTERGTKLANKNLLVDIRDSKSNHYGGCINYTTDNDGKIYVPVIATGGTKIVRCRYTGDSTYNSAFLEQEVFVNNNYEVNTVIESDDITYSIGQTNKEFSVKLLYADKGLSNETIKFIIYNDTEYVERTATTDINGVASIPIYLTNGAWYIDTYYSGKKVINPDGSETYYAPAMNNNIIKSLVNTKKDTVMTGENVIINDNDDEPYKITLTDTDGLPLKDKIVKFIVCDESLITDEDDGIKFNGNILTDNNGVATLPFYDVKTNLKVEAIFYGDVSYEPCSITNYVSFYGVYYENESYFVNNVGDIYLYREDGTPIGNENVTLNITSTTKNTIYNTYTYEVSTSNTTNIGKVPLPVLSDGEYYINVIHHNDTYKATNYFEKITVTGTPVRQVEISDNYLHSTDDAIIDFNSIDYAGKLFKCELKITDEETGKIINGAYLKCTNTDDEFISDCYSDENGIAEFYVLNPNDGSEFTINVEISVGMMYDIYQDTIKFTSEHNTLLNDTEIQFNYREDETFNPETLNYQEIDIKVTDDNTTDDVNVGNNFIVRCTNLDNNEYFEINGMCANKLNKNLLDFYLNNGNWNVSFYGVCNENYKDCLNNETIEVNGDEEDNPISELITIEGINIEDSVMNGSEEDTTMFGSLATFEVRNDKVNIYDYGYTNNDDTTDVKIKVEDIPLPENQEYYFRIVIRYGNANNISLNPCEGLLQIRLIEDVKVSDLAIDYNNLIVSPIPLSNNICKFTRLTDEGRLYYYNYNGVDGTKYIGSPYNFYKGGTNLKNELGAEIFDLSTGANPIIVTNGLCKMAIHRLSGYIELFVYNANDKDWYEVNVLKIEDHDYTMSLNNYDDDRIIVTFSDVTFTMWRGKPYIEIQHNGKDIRILNYKDRVYCELEDNEFEMRLIEESEVGRGIFDVNTSVQKFNEELQVGQNISLDNFDLYTYEED